MKKSIKNAIMIGMAAVMIGTSAVTYSLAKVNTQVVQLPQGGFSQEMPQFGQNDGQNGDMKGGMPGGNQQNGISSDNSSDNNNSNQQPPEMPGNNQNSDSNSGSNQQPPEMPDNSQNSGSSDSNSQQPPAMPGNDQSSSSDEEQAESTAPQSEGTSLSTDTDTAKMMPQGQNEKGGMTKNNMIIASLCYAFLALQIGILLLIIVYLIMSKFNKLSFNEVFKK